MIGIDVVDVERFRKTIARSPRLVDRFFTAAEIAYTQRYEDPVIRLAGTFAAKEAVMKAAGKVPAAAFAARIEIVRSDDGAPKAVFDETTIPISISHDGGVAAAVAFVGRA